MGRLAATRLYYTQALSVELVYRFALLQSFLTIGITLAGLLAFWLAAGAAAGASSSYTQGSLIAYFLIVSALGLIHDNRLSWNLGSAIRMGKLSSSMLRPYPFLLSQIAFAAAHATLRIVLCTPILILIAVFVPAFGDAISAMPYEALLSFLAAMALSFAIGWLVKIALGTLAFSMTQTWGPELIFMSFYAAASGIAYPPDLLTGMMKAAIGWTPFYYMIGFPTLVLLGRIAGPTLEAELLRGVLVLGVTLALVIVLWRRGLTQFEAVGI